MASTSGVRRKTANRNGDFTLDDLDRAILQKLREDARTPILQIAKKIGRHPNTCRDRLAMLEKHGYIHKYTILFSAKTTNFRHFKYLLVRAIEQNSSTINELGQWIASLSGVIMCDKIEG